MSGLAEQLLGTRLGVTMLAAGEASGRLDEALTDPGLTLCLFGHALREVARGTDGGRIDELVADPPTWLRAVAADVEARTDLGWWSRPARDAVQRQVSDGVSGNELVDHDGRARCAGGEVPAHLHTFTAPDRRDPLRRWRPDPSVSIVELDGPGDWEAVGRRVPQDVDGVHLTLRGALTIEPDDADWPWQAPGTVWHVPVPGTPLPDDDGPSWRHDHDWVAIGRPFDPRFDEGDEIDGSELTE